MSFARSDEIGEGGPGVGIFSYLRTMVAGVVCLFVRFWGSDAGRSGERGMGREEEEDGKRGVGREEGWGTGRRA